MRHWPAIAVALALAATPAAASQSQTLGFDLLAVLKVAYYPVQVMAYCFKEVQPNAKYQTAGNDWVKRNQPLLDQVEAMAKAQHVSNDLRNQADKETLDAIQKTVASQPDKGAYCSLISSVVSGGGFDLNVRQDIGPQMKRIFPNP